MGLDWVVFLNSDFYERSENYFPIKGTGKGIYRVLMALSEGGSSKEVSGSFFLSELFLSNFWIGVILDSSVGSLLSKMYCI